MLQYVNVIHGFAADYRAQNFRLQNFCWRGRSNILIEDHEISEHARRQFTFLFFGKLGEGSAGSVRCNRLLDRQLLSGIVVFFPSSLMRVSAA